MREGDLQPKASSVGRCVVCSGVLENGNVNHIITGGICSDCAAAVSKTRGLDANQAFIEGIDAAVLLMQDNPRLVYTANLRAGTLFAKGLDQIQDHRGGEVFDCVNSMTELGCGKDPGCEQCKIKTAIVDSLATGESYYRVFAALEVKKNNGTSPYNVAVSTERVGELALVRIDQYEPADS